MRFLRSLLFAAATVVAFSFTVPVMAPIAYAAESARPPWIAAPRDLVFNSGGISGKFLYFEDWALGSDYSVHTVIQHSSALWVSMTDPVCG